ncbi:MAG: UDP-N-acetylmuramate:L-alanyl-gamma-D-glutamyl-meso-diaminopimelate ligase [Acidobacteriota bacterium]
MTRGRSRHSAEKCPAERGLDLLPQAAKRVHLIGICGTAMATLAAMLKSLGYEVAGSDQGVYPPMSTFLEAQGIQLHQGYDEKNLNPIPDLVVVGNAISRGNPEVEFVLNRKLRFASLPEVLKEFFLRGKRVIVVAGTHGKTTTTSLLAWLLDQCGMDPSFLVGGIAENFGSSFRLGKGDWFVIEGDEYDTAFFDKGPKFLHYLPEQVVFNNCEFDHADIYPDFEAVQLSFRRLINIIPSQGRLYAGWDDPAVRSLSAAAWCPVESFGLNQGAAWSARSVAYGPDATTFELVRDGASLGTVTLPLAGAFNVRNALAALVCASSLGAALEPLCRALARFRNVKRRLEVRGEAKGVTVFDDFAHHPTAIRETLAAMKARYPQQRIWAIFEPRSATSRRNVFQKEFSQAFEAADRVVLAALYAPEKLPPAERLNVPVLVEELRRQGIPAEYGGSSDEIVAMVAPRLEAGDKVVIMSNGSFDGLHDKLLRALRGH